MKKILVLFVVFCLFSFVMLTSQYAAASASLPPGGAEESLAPDFTLETIAGKSVSLKDYKDKGVILFFFTTWCPYCLQKLPALARNYEKYRSEGIELLAIDGGETKTKVISFIAKKSLPFDILLDKDLKIAQDYGVLGVPTFVLISKDGRVVYNGNEMPQDYKDLFNK